MPYVRIRYKDIGAARRLRDSAEAIAEKIAFALTSSEDGGQVTPDRVKLEFGSADPMDYNTREVDVQIQARAFPGRIANERERTEAITRIFREVLGVDVSLSVFVVFHRFATYRERV
jgi:hypothetical protein